MHLDISIAHYNIASLIDLAFSVYLRYTSLIANIYELQSTVAAKLMRPHPATGHLLTIDCSYKHSTLTDVHIREWR